MTEAQPPDELLLALAALPAHRPFTVKEAAAATLRPQDLRTAVALGYVWHPVRGVYVLRTLADTLALRIAVLRLVVPRDCVVTDQTAAWLWGADHALPPNAHLTVPRVTVFAPPGRRLRNGLVDSGERFLKAEDLAEVDGLLVTTPLRTACDLGRLLHRDQSLAGMDALAALGMFTVEELNAELCRFKGYRGIIQARALAPLVDPKSGSHSESVMRLRWIDAGLPKPECQIAVPAPDGGWFYLDMGLRELKFAGEYDGEEFHGEDRVDHDADRRAWAAETEGWLIVVARRHNIYSRGQDISQVLRREYRARRRK